MGRSHKGRHRLGLARQPVDLPGGHKAPLAGIIPHGLATRQHKEITARRERHEFLVGNPGKFPTAPTHQLQVGVIKDLALGIGENEFSGHGKIVSYRKGKGKKSEKWKREKGGGRSFEFRDRKFGRDVGG